MIREGQSDGGNEEVTTIVRLCHDVNVDNLAVLAEHLHDLPLRDASREVSDPKSSSFKRSLDTWGVV